MTTPDHNQPDDAEFEDFLQGRGELVKQLKALSQLTPSAALDAAILASAKAAVAQAERSKQAAANDPVSPHKPGLMSRFRMPLAMAASLMVAVLVAVQWHVQSDDLVPIQLAQAPAAEPAPASVAAAPQVAPAQTNAKALSVAPAKNVPAAPPPVAATKPAPAAPEVRPLISEKKAALPPPPPPPPANAVAANQALKAERSEATSTQADAGQMRYKSAAMQDQRAAADANLAKESARAIATPAAPPAPAAAAAPPPEPAAKAELQERQKALLAHIDELIKADLRSDALSEWARFEKTYPDYPVPEALKAKIKALKN